MEKWYELEIETIEEYLVTNITTGLPQEQVDDRQQEYGKNVFKTKKKTSLVRRILHQLRDVSTIVLLVAAALSFLLAFKEGSSFIEPTVILAIVVLNVTLAITQEGKAEKSLEALAEMNSPNCTVFRDDIRKTIDTSEVVIGDIIILETGSIVPADARLIESFGLSCDELSLTGESEPVEKDATISISGTASVGDQSNMVFSGCIVSTGHGTAIVTAIGMDTQMGQIASHLHNTETLKTPLQVRLDSLGRVISWIAIASALFLLAIGLRGGADFGTMIMIAISMAVAAVPETLSLIVTLSLTNGVQKMVTKNALIRKLPAVETLGNTSVICSDKTGTLTQNRMTIKHLWRYGTPQISSDDNFGRKEEELVTMLALASNATIDKNEEGKTEYIGNATEVAIMQLLSKKGLEKSTLEDRYPKVAEIPFSSERKRMSVILKETNGYLIITKGALDRLPLEEMSNQKYQEIMAVHDSYAKKALRVIAVAIRYVKKLPDENELEKLEQNMSFVGLIGLIDPPRPQAAEAIEKAKKAGIQTVMITGDHATTASAIAEEIGILSEGKKILTGSELSHMSEQELNDTVKNYAVYARVSPEDKIRIVKAWQENGDVVAMTGDGVNDAPALKAADVGISMGITGTEVAKNASDMVLTDDNFATIVEAVSVGRNVYENIKKTICFLLVCNLSEIVIMLFAQMAGWGIVLTPIMLLLINLLGDGIPGLQLAKEVSDEDIMAKKPIKRNQGLFTADMLRLILRQTVSCSVVSLLAFYIGSFIDVSNIMSASLDIGQTMAFLTIGWTSILHIFNVRSKKSVFETTLSNNKPLTMSAIAMIVVFGLLVATPIGNIFGLTHIGFVHWLIVIVLSILPTLSHELGRVADNNPHSIRRRTYNYIKR
ncbi:calcium-translocating P-type ATPase, PMCA-type [Breznakia pachnodae]|uniref:P-type Ca(2+) transporter n=1 Tax=Breznakia pachnodae TaxID=265178 RepID=A0ABU0DXS0_9FIRM|nr:calcium-translocating P-type ATPase, PMCA-type [Breznakia pachnodae]MDQ0359431.1 calcium-translocating P-type ATPase [Breznakia pachnodae]